MTAATGQRWRIDNDTKWEHFKEHVSMLRLSGNPPTVQFLKEQRTLSQNALINALYGQIAAQSDDNSTLDVRRQCKLHYGVGILKTADSDFCEFYDRAIKGMSYEDKLFLMTYMDITSHKSFGKPQGSEYIDTIIREYGRQGYSLTHPSEA